MQMTLHPILHNLYLSNFHSAQQETTSNTFIVNCSKDLPMVREQGIRIAVDDNGSQQAMHDMFRALPEALEQIHHHLENHTPVVVHCLAGQQRSPAVIAAYLVRYHGYSLEDAIRYVRAAKPDAFFWTVNFKDALEWYTKLMVPNAQST